MPLVPEPSAPAWARTLGNAGFREFIALIHSYFAARQIPIALQEDEGIVSPDYEVLSRSSVFGLQNIAQKCSHAGRERWSALIAEHFDCLFEPNMSESVLGIDMRSLSAISGRLRSRLYPEGILKQTGALAFRPYAEGLLEVLVLDMQKSVRTVSRSETAQWPLTEDELFMLGRRNLAASAFLDETRVALPGAIFHMLSGDAFYGASHMLIFDRYITEPHPNGIVVSMPKRDVIFAHYVQNIGVLEAISGMLQITTGMYEEGPGSLSDNLYWYRNGALTRLPYQLNDGAFSFAPPEEFADLLHELSAHAQLS
jgi:hypothetical protein